MGEPIILQFVPFQKQRGTGDVPFSLAVFLAKNWGNPDIPFSLFPDKKNEKRYVEHTSIFKKSKHSFVFWVFVFSLLQSSNRGIRF